MTIANKSREKNQYDRGNTIYDENIKSLNNSTNINLNSENNLINKINDEFNKNLFSVDYILEKQHKVKSYNEKSCTSIYGDKFPLKYPIRSSEVSANSNSNIKNDDFRHGARKFIRDAYNVFKAAPRKPEHIMFACEAIMLANICAKQYKNKGNEENLAITEPNFEKYSNELFEDVESIITRINKVISKEHAKMNLDKGDKLLKKGSYQEAYDAFTMAKSYSAIAREYGSGNWTVLYGGNLRTKGFSPKWKSLEKKPLMVWQR